MKKEMVIQMVGGNLVHQDEEVSADFSLIAEEVEIDEEDDISSDDILNDFLGYLEAQKDEDSEVSENEKTLLKQRIETIKETSDLLSKEVQKKVEEEMKDALTYDFLQRISDVDAMYHEFFQSLTRMSMVSKMALLGFCRYRLEDDSLEEYEKEEIDTFASMLAMPRYCGYFETPAGVAFCTALGRTIDHFFFVSGIQLDDLSDENIPFFMEYGFSKMEANGVDTTVVEWRNETCQDLFDDLFETNDLEDDQLRILEGTDLEKEVWEALTEIPMGSMTTCTELAKKLGYPESVEEVAQAVMNNPIPCIIPCHRVIEKIGEKGSYVYPYGQKRQQKLLNAEAKRRVK